MNSVIHESVGRITGKRRLTVPNSSQGILRRVLVQIFVGIATLSLCTHVVAQQKKLPSAERVVNSYLKAIGGKKRVATIRDATYEWIVQLNNQTVGTAKTQILVPASARAELVIEGGQLLFAANARSAWMRGQDGKLQTLTGAEANAARLQAVLDASHLLDLKKRNVLARVVSYKNTEPFGPAYVVEFSLRSGARLRYWFDTITKLLRRIDDEELETITRFEDYRPEGIILEPHRVLIHNISTRDLTFVLHQTRYNTGLSDTLFDPPRSAETLDVTTLLREVSRNQNELEKRFAEYSFLQKQTDREINSKGELKKETTKVYEVFPVLNREPVMKLISENGVRLSGDRAAQEQKRVEEEFLRVERDQGKNAQKAEKRRLERQRQNAAKGDEDDGDLDVSQFLKVHEFVSPRRERFRDREAVVFDFRPRPGFKSSNRKEDLISKLVGVVWIDPADKQIMRLEARLAEGFKMAGGLLLSLRPGAAFVMEQTRMEEGVWLPREAQINLSMKFLLFGGSDLNKRIEWSDYKHFSGNVGDYKLEAPKNPNDNPEKP
jgi:hypothetical protein